MDKFEQRVISIICQVGELDENRISYNSTFDELNLGSLDAVSIAFEIEDEFGVEIPDNMVYAVSTIQELLDGVKKLVGEREAKA